jgi:hypothetical protein
MSHVHGRGMRGEPSGGNRVWVAGVFAVLHLHGCTHLVTIHVFGLPALDGDVSIVKQSIQILPYRSCCEQGKTGRSVGTPLSQRE